MKTIFEDDDRGPRRPVDDEPKATLPRDEFSVAWREKAANPEAVTKKSTVELSDMYGNVITWHIKTVRIQGNDTVFLQRNDASGGARWVLPADVTAVLARHRDGAVTTTRRKVASRVAADRKAMGYKPTFVKKEKAS